MNFHKRKWVKPEDLNPHGTLFGGTVLSWIDEEAAIYAICQLDSKNVVTKYISEIDFVHTARKGDIVEIGLEVSSMGKSSITLRCLVRNKQTHQAIISIEKLVFVNIDKNGHPLAHHKTIS